MKTILRIRLVSWLAVGGALLPSLGFGMKPGPEIQAALDEITLGAPIIYRDLTLYPLISAGSGIGADYLTLDDALEKGLLSVEEKNGGTVPEVMVSNLASLPVFIFAGEMVAGARQDRIVRQDTLLAPCGGRMSLAVYCVESGRWQGKSDRFEASYCNAGAYLRNIAQSGASQEKVWEGVAKNNRALGVATATGTLRAVYTSSETRKVFDEYAERLDRMPELVRGTVGVVVCSGGEIVCADIFGSPNLFRAEWKKILKSYIADGIAASRCGRMVEREEVASFLWRLHSPQSVTRERGVSLGENVRLTWPGGFAAGLLYRGCLVHLSLFPEREAAGSSTPGGVTGTGNRGMLNR